MSWVALVVAALAGAFVGSLLAQRIPGRRFVGPNRVLPADHHHLLDLLRRAHRADAAALAVGDEPTVTSDHPKGIRHQLRERTESLARLAMNDGRHHIHREQEVIAAAGDGVVGVAVALAPGADDDTVERLLDDLVRLAAGLHAQLRREGAPVRREPTAVWGKHETYEAAGRALCEGARAIAEAPTAFVVRDPVTQIARIGFVSSRADGRLEGTSVAPESAAGRAALGDTPIIGLSTGELFGHPRSDRRRREERGIAFPVRDDRGRSFGSLVVFEDPDLIDEKRRLAIMDLATKAGAELAHLLAVKSAEDRSLTDALTGLPNRRHFDRLIAAHRGGAAALLCVDLDHFKQVNDTHGHVAGDAALKHVARLLTAALRDRDVALRVGGEEFACWLPGASIEAARDVAERVRQAVEQTPLAWSGAEVSLACSIGVAAVPESASSVANLYQLADAALYRAKDGGRNRVEVARKVEPFPARKSSTN